MSRSARVFLVAAAAGCTTPAAPGRPDLTGAPPAAGSPPDSQPAMSSPQPPAASGTSAPLERLHTATTSAYREPVELVIRDAAAWRGAWAAAFPNMASGPPAAPPVDFARDMVVLVAAGERPSGGHTVRVDAVEPAAGGGGTVRYTVSAPGSGCMTTQALTAPLDVVRTPRIPGDVRFVARRVSTPC